MVWKCPPLNLFNWNNLWKWKKQMRPDGNGITQDYLQQLFTYEKGNLYWKIKTTQKVVIGNMVGYVSKGRRYTKINQKTYQISRLVFMYHHGYFPKVVDHVNNNPLDNRIENLRECSHQQNSRNSKKPKHNTSGIKNVHWNVCRNRWKVQLMINAKSKCIGYFKDLELAELVAYEARLKYFGEFANHG